MDRIKNLKAKVLYVLEKEKETRNCDSLLTFHIIHTYLPDEMEQIDGKWYISTKALKLVREDNCKRLRAKIQNEENRFLPTDNKVRKARKINEERWRDYLSNESERM